MEEVLMGLAGEAAKSSILNRTTHFIADMWNEQQMRQMFVETGAEVAGYERNATEESEFRQIVFSKENMETVAKHMRDVDDFSWMQMLQEGIHAELRKSGMSEQNQENCEQHFMQIIRKRIQKKNPQLISRSLQMETLRNVQNIAEHVGSMDGRIIQMEEMMRNMERERYESRQHQRQEGVQTETETGSGSEAGQEEFEIPKWNLNHTHVDGILGAKEGWEKDIHELIRVWKMEREQYPGWYIPPYAVCEELSIYTRDEGLLQKHTVVDLHTMFAFAYEYVWRTETCMNPYSHYEFYHIHEIWKKYMAEIDSWDETAYDKGQKDTIKKWFYIGQALLRSYRENGEDNTWKEVYGQLKRYEKYGVNGNIDLQLEKVKYSFQHLDIAAMRRDISKCCVKKENYEQRLQILGLRAELNETEAVIPELEQLMKDLNEADRTGSEDHVYFITLQTCVLQLHSLCTQGMYDFSGKYESHLEMIHAIEARIEEKKALFDWRSWKDNTEHSLLRWHVRKYETKDAFELNRETVTIMSSDNSCIPAYRFYRVLESLALPYQCGYVTLLGDWEQPWIEAVVEISDTLGLFLLCQSTKSNTIKTLVDRSYLSCISGEKAEVLVGYLINALSQNIDEIGEMERPYGVGLISNIAQNVPELIIRYMSRCTETGQRDAMLLVKQLMECETISTSFPMVELCIGVMREVSEKVKAQMLDEMLRTEIIEHRTMHGYGDGIDFFAFYFQKEEIGTLRDECRVSQETVAWLLENPGEDGYVWNTKVSRLETLDRMELLSEKQRRAYGELLWSYVSETTGLPKLENFHLFAFEKLPCGDPSRPACSVKNWFLSRMLKEQFDDEKGCKATMGEIPYLEELILVCSNTETGYWSTDEADILLGYITEYWDILQQRLEKPETNGFVERELCRRGQKMEKAAAAVCRNVRRVSEKARHTLIVMMNEMESYEISVRELEVQIAEDDGLIKDICEEMNSVQHEMTVGALVAAEQYIRAHSEEPSAQILIAELIRLLRYRKMPGLASAICVLHNLTYVRCPIIRQGENLKAMDRCLDSLANDIQRDNLFGMPIKEVLHVRKACMALAFQLFQIEGAGSGAGVQQWRALAQNPEEINEVKNEWVWDI